MSNVMVTKRDGSIEEFKVEKVRKCINWACENLHVNPLALESKFNEYLQGEVSSSSIQENLIFCSRSMATSVEPDWLVVSGRLLTMNMWKTSGILSKSFYDVLTDGAVGYDIDSTVLGKYSLEDIETLGKAIQQERDLNHSYGSVLTAKEKYLLPNECIQQMLMINSMIMAGVEDENRVNWALAFYEALSKRKLSLATPWLSNLRSNGNIDSCFIIKVGDNIKSIFDNVSRAASISKNGGGLGIDFSELRASGSSVAGRPDSAKSVPFWVRIYNDTAVAVDQGGKRAGAFTVHLPIWHRDIETFLEMQHETGDLRTRCFDIFPQVGIHDLFMKLDEKSAESKWHTFCPYEVKQTLGESIDDKFGKDFERVYYKAVKAYEQGKLANVKVFTTRNLIKMIMRTQFDSGLPYLAYRDTINLDNPNNHEGTIPCVNLCNESFSVVKTDEYAHSCNLLSVVAGRCEDLEEVVYLSGLATRMLDNGISLTQSPAEIAKAHGQRYRTIGIGIQGLHDWLAKNNKTYSAKKDIAAFAEAIQYGAVAESIQIAKQKGKYPAFEGSKWDNGEQINKYAKNSVNGYDWKGLQGEIDKYGIRNSQLTSPAPNTSSSIFMDAGAGVMPCYAGFYKKSNANGEFAVAGMYLKEAPLIYAKNASRYDHHTLVDAVAEIQKFVDAGISSEYIFDHNRDDFSAKQLYDLIHYAWKKKTKAVYYIRHIKKGKNYSDEVGIEKDTCEGCAD